MTALAQAAPPHLTHRSEIPPEDRLIVALDVPTVAEAREVVHDLGDRISFYKIGAQLQLAGGVQLASDLISEGKKIFLDSKLSDIARYNRRSRRGNCLRSGSCKNQRNS